MGQAAPGLSLAEPPMPRSKGRTGRPWRRIRAQVLAESALCWLCGHPLNKTLPRDHPLAAVVDHVIPLSKGGDPLDRANLRAAHRRCNATKGARIAGPPRRTSRAW